MADNKIRLPSSEGGLVRYGDDAPSAVSIDPKYVIGAAVAIIIIFGYIAAFVKF